MKNRSNAAFIILFVVAMVGLSQFSQGLRSVDILGLFASGALAGAAITGFLITRARQ